MRAEMFQDGKPFFIDIGCVTAEERDVTGSIHVLCSKVSRLMGRFRGSDALFEQFRERRAESHHRPKREHVSFCQEDLCPVR